MKSYGLFFTLLLVVLSFFPVQATPPHVDESQKTLAGARIFVSNSGNDNNYGTQVSPFETIYRALEFASPGDTIIVNDGTYEGVRYSNKHGTPDKWITIRARNKWGAKIETAGGQYCFTLDQCSYIAVDGFEFTQETDLHNRAYGYGFLHHFGHHITVRNCHAHHCGGNGISMAYGDYFTAENNVVHDNASWDVNQTSGISIYEPIASDNNPGFHLIVRGNISYKNVNKTPNPGGEYTDGNGIILDDFLGTQGNSGAGAYTPASLVENNICFLNGRKGIHVFVSQNVTVRNNTCYWNNAEVRDPYTWNGELSNVWSKNNKWINNIAWANPAFDASNTAILDAGDASWNKGVEWINNLTYNGTPGDASIRQEGTSATISAATGNLLGRNPMFANTALNPQTGHPDLQLLVGSPAIDAGALTDYSAYDVIGVVRPQGAGIDLGAYEFSDTPSQGPPGSGGGGTGGTGGTGGGGTGAVTPISQSSLVRLNQIGFYTEGPKIAIIADAGPTDFIIASTDQLTQFYFGILGDATLWPYSGEIVRVADFSDFVTPGEYVLVIPGVGSSAPFKIKSDVHEEVSKASLKSFYFQRASVALPSAFAGQWERQQGHEDADVIVHESASSAHHPTGTLLNASGGWYDSGNYGKYVVPSALSTFTLLSAYEQFPAYYDLLEANIPESGANLPDLLDEIVFSLRWLLKMQEQEEGFVYHKLTGLDFAEMEMPWNDQQDRYLIGKSTAAALDFAAVMAQAARVFKPYHAGQLPGFADSCLTASRLAWGWARSNPNEIFVNPADVYTLEYHDEKLEDEFIWAAAELYISTLEDSFYLAANLGTLAPARVHAWDYVAPLALISLSLHRNHLTTIANPLQIKNKFMNYVQPMMEHAIGESGYRVPMGAEADHFRRGSNGICANLGQLMMLGYAISGDVLYLDAGMGALDYLLGRNATAYSFVTMHGTKTPMFIHNRITESDGVTEPIPGLLVGGPQRVEGDLCQYDLYGPATHYVDAACSYTTNENTILQNSSLVYLLAAAENLIAGVDPATSFPVVLTYFDAIPENHSTVRLKWETAQEVNNSHFDIERSMDGLIFEKLERVNGAGSSNSTREYTRVDKFPFSGVSYYRLKQTDIDGAFTYSHTVKVNLELTDDIQVQATMYPNPAQNQVSFSIEASQDLPANITIYTMMGALVRELEMSVQHGVNEKKIDISDLNNGVYFIEISAHSRMTFDFERLAAFKLVVSK